MFKIKNDNERLKWKTIPKQAARFDNRYYDSPIFEYSEYLDHIKKYSEIYNVLLIKLTSKFVEQTNLYGFLEAKSW